MKPNGIRQKRDQVFPAAAPKERVQFGDPEAAQPHGDSSCDARETQFYVGSLEFKAGVIERSLENLVRGKAAGLRRSLLLVGHRQCLSEKFRTGVEPGL